MSRWRSASPYNGRGRGAELWSGQKRAPLEGGAGGVTLMLLKQR